MDNLEGVLYMFMRGSGGVVGLMIASRKTYARWVPMAIDMSALRSVSRMSEH